MNLKLEVHVPANGATATGIVHDADSGSHVIFAWSKGRWEPLCAAVVGRNEFHRYTDGDEWHLPIEVEGNLNRIRDTAMRRAKAARSYTTMSYPV